LWSRRRCGVDFFEGAHVACRIGGGRRQREEYYVAAPQHRTSLIVVELGALWPDWVSSLSYSLEDAAIETQADDETADEFSQRVVRRVYDLAQQRVHIDFGLMLTNGATDDGNADARFRMARAVLRGMADAGAGELLLAADSLISDDARHQLFALAGTLCDELYGAELGVRVRFSTRSAQSGKMPSARPRSDEPIDAVG
jgi:hypothetical protein